MALLTQFAGVLVLFVLCAEVCAAVAPKATPQNVTVAAFIYDPWTHDPVVFGRHGPNWTEWELVKAATPRFAGHNQPHQPLWGYFDTSLPATWDLLNGAAVAAGITTYLWDWYWWPEAPSNPLLVRGLESGFLHAPSSSSVKWGVMWANQDWSDIFPAKRLDAEPPMFHGAVNATVFTALSQYWIDKYFTQASYLTLPNPADSSQACPLVSIYDAQILVDGLGGLNATAAALADFRQRAAAAGFPCVHVMVMGWHARTLPAPVGQTLAALGVNSVTDYCWQHYADMPSFPLTDYDSYAASAIGMYQQLAQAVAPLPYVPNFGVAWDPSPRTVQSDAFDNWGYPATPVLQPSPAQIQSALTAAAAAVAGGCDPVTSPLSCWMSVYAYTEFSEGGSLFPTVADGYGRLDAFQAVFGNRTKAV